MSVLILPSFIALVLKVWMIWYARENLKSNPTLPLVILLMLVWNCAEFLSFSTWRSALNPEALLRCYYVGLTLTATAIAQAIMRVLNIQTSAAYITLWAAGFCTTLLVAIPGLALMGVTEISYSITRIPGPLYPVWQLFMLVSLSVVIALLIHGNLHSKDLIARRRTFALMVGLAPLIGMGLSVLLSMQIGYKVNGTLLLSLMSSFFLVTLIYTEQRYRLFKLLSFVPYTPERELNTQFKQATLNLHQGAYTNAGFKDQLKELETLCLRMAIYAADGNKTQAARNMGISSATLHRKLPSNS